MSSVNAHLALPLGTVYSLEGGKGEEGVCKKLIFAVVCVRSKRHQRYFRGEHRASTLEESNSLLDNISNSILKISCSGELLILLRP